MKVTLIDLEKAFDSVQIFVLIFILIRKKFSTPLIRVMRQITKSKCIISEEVNLSIKLAKPIQHMYLQYFKTIYLQYFMFCIKTKNITYSMVDAHNTIFYTSRKMPQWIYQRLEEILNKVTKFYAICHLKLNFVKYETIILKYITTKIREKRSFGSWNGK